MSVTTETVATTTYSYGHANALVSVLSADGGFFTYKVVASESVSHRYVVEVYNEANEFVGYV